MLMTLSISMQIRRKAAIRFKTLSEGPDLLDLGLNLDLLTVPLSY